MENFQSFMIMIGGLHHLSFLSCLGKMKQRLRGGVKTLPSTNIRFKATIV